MISLIAAVGKNRELGLGGKLVFRIKDDMRFFKETTMGHAVLMGRKTWESLPAGGLKGRRNIVVSRHEVPGADEAVSDLMGFVHAHEDDDEEIFVIGGGMVYFETIKYAGAIYLTEVDAEAEADTFFPEFDKSKYDRMVIKEGRENDLAYSIVKYSKK